MGLNRIIKPAIKILGRCLLAGALITTPLLNNCSGKESAQGISKERAPAISRELQEQWPIWNPFDLEAKKYKGNAYVYDVEIFEKLKFYNGPMPLQYETLKTPDYGGFSGGLSKTLCDKFKDFSNYFIYDGFSLVGAVSVNNDNIMVAEAKINPYVQKEGEIPSLITEIEEFHYNEGLLTFHCMSEYDSLGFKEKESQVSGKKKRDFFFVLPRNF